MKTKMKLALIGSLSAFSIKAQMPSFQWAQQFSGPSSEQAWNITTDAPGNVYTVGSFNYASDFDPGPATYPLIPSGPAGFDDAFVSKLDKNGNFLWAKRWGSTGMDRCSSVFADNSGNVYTTGYFAGTVDFDPGPGSYTLSSAGLGDAFISKLDVNGNLVWVKKIGGTSVDNGAAIVEDAAGDVFISGHFSNTVDFDPGAGTYTLTASGSNNNYILKLNSAGNFIWAKQLTGVAQGASIAVDAAGSVFTTGYYNGNVDFDPGPSTYTLNSVFNDVYVLKLDGSGSFVFVKQISGTGADQSFDLTLDPTGNICLTGFFDGTTDFDPGAGTYTLSSFGVSPSADVFVLKLNPAGIFIWAKQLGGNSNTSDWGYGIDTDIANNVYVTGIFSGTADFDPGSGTFNLISYGYNDGFICELDASGNFVGAGQMGGPGVDVTNCIAINNSGDIYMSGYFDTGDMDPFAGVSNITAGGNVDVAIIKLKQISTGVSSVNVETAFLVFPNPTQDLFFIQLQDAEETDIQISNMSGQIVFEKKVLEQNNTSIDISSFPAGVYVLKVVSEKSKHVSRITKL